MKRFKLGLSAFFLLTVFTLKSAHAIVWFEPYVGQSIRTITQTQKASTGLLAGTELEFAYAMDGIVYGAKLGMSFTGIAFGVQYEMGSADLEFEELEGSALPVTIDPVSYDITNMGGFATFSALPWLNLGASYFFSSELEDEDGGVWSGGGYGVLVGFGILPMISLNIEYRSFTYDEYELDGQSITYPTTVDGTEIGERESKEMVFGISVPLDL